jgi:hypothetical protein
VSGGSGTERLGRRQEPRTCRLRCFLPLPLQDVVLVQPGSVCLPRDLPAPVWQRLGPLPQIVAALSVAFNQDSVLRWPGTGEDYVDLEVFRPVRDVRFPLLRLPQEALADPPFDVELIHISLVLNLAP